MLLISRLKCQFIGMSTLTGTNRNLHYIKQESGFGLGGKRCTLVEVVTYVISTSYKLDPIRNVLRPERDEVNW
jgi:hypothetical protein